MEATTGLDERLTDAVAREQEFRGELIMDWHWNVKNFAEHTSGIVRGVMLASLAEVAQTRMR